MSRDRTSSEVIVSRAWDPLAANHSRPCDPLILGMLARRMAVNLHVMASWSVFKPSALQTFVARRLGAFSVYREGMGRVLLNTAIETLVEARRPLMIFPEGVISRTHDCLGELMDGAAFMARQAAKKRNKQNPDAKVVIHPIAVKYQFPGDLDEAIMAILTEIEERLTWKPQSKASLFGRISKIGNALVALKEIEFLGGPQSGYIHERIDPLARVKNLRMAIVPDMVEGAISDDERDRRWRQLADLYLAQQLRFYPAGYVAEGSPAERVLETVERFEEDLTDCSRPHGPLKAVLKVGEAIEVSTERHRRQLEDPLMVKLKAALTSMLDSLASELNHETGANFTSSDGSRPE